MKQRMRRRDAGVEELGKAPLLGVAYGYPGRPGGGAATARLCWACNAGACHAPGHRPADDQLFRVDRLAHTPARAGGRGLGEALARRLLADPRRAERAAVHAGDQRRVQSGVAVVPVGLASRTSSAVTTSPAIRGRSRSWSARATPVELRGGSPKRHAGSGTMTWCAPALPTSCPRTPKHPARFDALGGAVCWSSRCCCCSSHPGHRLPAGQGLAHHLPR